MATAQAFMLGAAVTLALPHLAAAQATYHYECRADSASGFIFDETVRSWRSTIFRVDRTYTLRALTTEEVANPIGFAKGKTWGAFEPDEQVTINLCSEPADQRFFCGGPAVSFIMDLRSMRYQRYYQGTYVSGVDGNSDTPFIEIGRCSMKSGAR